jgi:hypothetical protein
MVAVGRFDDARAAVVEHTKLSRSLSPHHRLHSVSLEIELDEGLGRWDAIVEATGALADAMVENRATYCMRHARGLFVCAVAHAVAGAQDRADELEREGTGLSGEGHDFLFVGPRIRLALVRGDVAEAHRLADQPLRRTWVFGPSTVAAKLDALAAARDTERVEPLAEVLIREPSYVEPFALRALGIVRRDDGLLARADERFAALGLGWHAAQGAALGG